MELIDKMFQFPHTGKIQLMRDIIDGRFTVFQFPLTGKIQYINAIISTVAKVSIPTHG